MGYGDALMAAGTAERIYRADPSRGPVIIRAGNGKMRWNPLWERNPAVFCPSVEPIRHQREIIFGHGHLPYYPPLDTPQGRRWPTEWRVRDHRPSVYLTGKERSLGDTVRRLTGPFILLEPTGTDRKSPNRTWPLDRWQRLADALMLAGEPVAQLVRPEANRLTGVFHVEHTSFREACGTLQAASLLVSTEGGLQIAAGTLRVPAVILLSPCGPPESVIGFPEHLHIVDGDPRTPCGYLTPCSHCAAAWDRLYPETVFAAVMSSLHRMAHGVS